MKKKLNIIFLTIFHVSIIIAILMQLGKLINKSETNSISQEVKEVSALADSSSGGSFDAGSLDGAPNDPFRAYAYKQGITNAYCASHGVPITLYNDSGVRVADYYGGISQITNYATFVGEQEIDQGLAYVYAFQNSDPSSLYNDVVQQRIWAMYRVENNSIGSGSGSTETTNADKFATYTKSALNSDGVLGLEYGRPIIHSGGKMIDPILDIECINIDAEWGRYIIGPYNIDISTHNQDGRDILYQEINNPTCSPQFCNGQLNLDFYLANGTTNGEKYTPTSNDNIDWHILDANQNWIRGDPKFPPFATDFYISIDIPKKLGTIEKIIPTLKINYMKKIKGKVSFYESKSVKYRMMQDNTKIFTNDKFTVGSGEDSVDFTKTGSTDSEIIFESSTLNSLKNPTTVDYNSYGENLISQIKDKITTTRQNVTNIDITYECGTKQEESYIKDTFPPEPTITSSKIYHCYYCSTTTTNNRIEIANHIHDNHDVDKPREGRDYYSSDEFTASFGTNAFNITGEIKSNSMENLLNEVASKYSSLKLYVKITKLEITEETSDLQPAVRIYLDEELEGPGYNGKWKVNPQWGDVELELPEPGGVPVPSPSPSPSRTTTTPTGSTSTPTGTTTTPTPTHSTTTPPPTQSTTTPTQSTTTPTPSYSTTTPTQSTTTPTRTTTTPTRTTTTPTQSTTTPTQSTTTPTQTTTTPTQSTTTPTQTTTTPTTTTPTQTTTTPTQSTTTPTPSWSISTTTPTQSTTTPTQTTTTPTQSTTTPTGTTTTPPPPVTTSPTPHIDPWNLYLGGDVFQALPGDKGGYSNQRQDRDISLAGIQVDLIEYDPLNENISYTVASTLTDKDGEYGFQSLNPFKKYKVRFTYDGMRFENVEITTKERMEELSGGYSTADELNTDRENFNDIYDDISTSPENYYKDGEWRKAYGMYTKIKADDGSYIMYNGDEVGENKGAFRYYDALQILNNLAATKHDFNQNSSNTMNDTYIDISNKQRTDWDLNSLWDDFKGTLKGIGVSDQEITDVWQFMVDTRMTAETRLYPDISPDEFSGYGHFNPNYPNSFVLKDVDNLANGEQWQYVEWLDTCLPWFYIQQRDMSRQVDFGLKLRPAADVGLEKDLYKTTIRVNGKEEVYNYNEKGLNEQGEWIIDYMNGKHDYEYTKPENRASNEFYNGTKIYTRPVRISDYLFDGSDVYGSSEFDARNLQVDITYRITVMNHSQVIFTKIPEIVDYYDENLEFKEAYLGDENGNRKGSLTCSDSSIYEGSPYNIADTEYINSNAKYITGIGEDIGDDIFENSEWKYIYITFKVKEDSIGKVLLNEQGNDNDKITNIAEINGYQTYYYDENGNWKKAGVIDQNSNPGNLTDYDLEEDGDIKTSSLSWEDRGENDCDQAPGLKIVIDQDDDKFRSIKGYVFEDARTSNKDNAIIGNGRYDEGDKDVYGNKDKKVDGITVELVELVRDDSEAGPATGDYIGEHVWNSMEYNYNEVNGQWEYTSTDERYASGDGLSRVVLAGQDNLHIEPDTLGTGEYGFKSIPPGDFFVRFKYGDTSETVMINPDETDPPDPTPDPDNPEGYKNNEVKDLLGTKGPDGMDGLNGRSYTGQDYKSTLYQVGVTQGGENSTYNGIDEFINPDAQNSYEDATKVASPGISNKQYMYYYNIEKGDSVRDVSDAIDVYECRENEMNYSKGSTDNSYSDGDHTLKNHRAEVLASATKLTTEAKELWKPPAYSGVDPDVEGAKTVQLDAIQELIGNTSMVAQTGIINTEIERNVSSTGTENSGYLIDDLDFGITERPEAQLALSKELTNIQIRLANGQILFDASHGVDNLIYGSHYERKDVYEKERNTDPPGFRLRQKIASEEVEREEELVEAQMDEELMSGATVTLQYTLGVDNIGEVDYADRQFYYTGYEGDADANIVTTEARRVIDYVTNEMNFAPDYNKDSAGSDNWNVTTVDEGLFNNTPDDPDDDLVNYKYKVNLDTYNVLITTTKLSDGLKPKASDKEPYQTQVNLTLSTLLSNTMNNNNQVYTNLTEIIETYNTVGRRMQLSRAGNQAMAYLSTRPSDDESTKWIVPDEIDADSGQKAQVTVPTGSNKNLNRMIIIAICTAAIIIISVVIIKKKVLKGNKKANS